MIFEEEIIQLLLLLCQGKSTSRHCAGRLGRQAVGIIMLIHHFVDANIELQQQQDFAMIVLLWAYPLLPEVHQNGPKMSDLGSSATKLRTPSLPHKHRQAAQVPVWLLYTICPAVGTDPKPGVLHVFG